MSAMSISEEAYYNGASIFQASAGFTKTFSDSTEVKDDSIDFASVAEEAFDKYLTQANHSAGSSFGDISNNNSLGLSYNELMSSNNKYGNNSNDAFNEASGVSTSTTNTTTSGTVANSYMQPQTHMNSLNTQMQIIASLRN